MPESTLRVWWGGTRALDEDVERRLVAVLGRPAPALVTPTPTPEPVETRQPTPVPAPPQIHQPAPHDAGVARALEALERLAGQERASDVDLRALARSQTAAALGTLVRLMLASKSDTVKQRAAEILIERGWGKAPKPDGAKPRVESVEDGELLARLETLLKGSAP